MAESTRTTVAALGELFDGPHATPTRRSDGPYFLNIASLKSGRLDLAESDHVSDEDFKRWTRRVVPHPGDLLFSYETRLGEAALMPEGIQACLGRRMALLRPNRAVIEPRFLLYLYLSPSFQYTIAKHTIHGATVPRIGLSTMPNWSIDLPSLSEQRAIAEVLGALDDKIAVNDRVGRSTDELLAAIFARLCIDTSWGTLKDIATINAAVTRPVANGSLRYVDISSVSVGNYELPPIISWDEAPSRARRVLKAGDTVWSTVRPNRRSHALVLDDDVSLIASTGLAVLSPNEGRVACVYESTRTDKFVQYLESVAEGSAYPAVREDRFNDAPIPALSNDKWGRFESMALPLRKCVHAAARETRSLATKRDELLPLLMSGKVRVRDAEKVVEEAV